jgi:HK97 gp10 family phage protein
MEITINGLSELINTVDKYPAISEKHVNKAIRDSLLRIQREATKNAPFGTSGNLRNNWKVNMKRFEGSLSSGAKEKNFSYGTSVEFGTKPHYVSGSNLSIWASRRGLNPYAVAKSISKKGTKANPFFKNSIDSQRNTVDRLFGEALENIIKEI